MGLNNDLLTARWHARVADWRARLRLVGLLPHAGPLSLASLGLTVAVTAAVPGASAVVSGHLIAAVAAGAPESAVGPALALAGLLLAGQMAEAARGVLEPDAAQCIDGYLRGSVRQLVLAPAGVAHLTDKSVGEDLLRAAELSPAGTGRQRSPGRAAIAMLGLTGRFASAAVAAAVIASFSPALACGLFAVAVMTRARLRRQWLHLVHSRDGAVSHERRARYWSGVLADRPDAKEVRLFGLADYVAGLRRQAAERWVDTHLTEVRRVLGGQGPTVALAAAAAMAGTLLPGLAARSGAITTGTLTACVVSTWAVLSVGFIGREAFDIGDGVRSLEALTRLRERLAVAPAATATVRASGTAVAEARGDPLCSEQPMIRFENVTFRYPAAARPVLDGLSLDIPAGSVTAIVGDNGAGKTTLVKLLAGLYAIDSGRITLDGRDLAEIDLRQWRRRLTVVFQEFVRYPLSVRDNIRLVAPERAAAGESLRRAAHVAGIDKLITALPDGLDTVLGDGHGLSGGQWQRLALARALYARAEGRTCIVLDEPTAHLDARAEARFYHEVINRMAGATVLLISHRLSTVREADRIVVLNRCRVSEAGTHDELLATGGRYAELFTLQASQYQGERG